MPRPRKVVLMGKLADAIKAETRGSGTVCTISVLNLPRDIRADLDAALRDAAVTSAAVARALTALGFQVSRTTIARHRNGECQCGRAR